jgi:integrase
MATYKAKITKTTVDKLKAGDTVWDTDLIGFGVRCQTKTKVYVYKKFYNGQQRWFSLGKPSEGMTVTKAREEAEIIIGNIRNNNDPALLREDQRNRPTIEKLCQRFLTDYAEEHKKPSSIRMDRKNIQNHILPLLGKKFVSDITLSDIDRFKRAVKDGKTAKALSVTSRGGSPVKGGSGAANRCLSLLSKAFNLSIRWGMRTTNPVQHVQKYKEKKIERFLSEKEFMALAEAIRTIEQKEETNPYAIAAIRLLIFTGARRGEILSLRWDAIDFDRQIIKLIDSKTGAKTIYLNPPALELLSTLEKQSGNPYVICGLKSKSHLVDVNRVWRHIRDRASVILILQNEPVQVLTKVNIINTKNLNLKTLKPLMDEAGLGMDKHLSDLRLHDLRHSFASIAVGGGMSLPMIGKLLGHTQTATTARYAHLADNPLKEANDAIGNRLQGLMGQTNDASIIKLGNKNEV